MYYNIDIKANRGLHYQIMDNVGQSRITIHAVVINGRNAHCLHTHTNVSFTIVLVDDLIIDNVVISQHDTYLSPSPV